MKLTQFFKELHSFGAETARQTLESPIYHAGISLFGVGVKIASIKNEKAAKMAIGHKNIWQKLKDEINPSAKYVWIHAASLGEFEQGRPLIEKIKRERPDLSVILTFFSPSGYEVRKNYEGADIVCYLPYDTPANARRFVNMIKPVAAVFVKYEIWRNYLRELYQLTIPTYLISAHFRPEQAFFKKRGAWYRAWLRWFTHIFVQDSESQRLLENVNIRNVTVAGDTRFDRVADIHKKTKKIPVLEEFCGKAPHKNEVVFIAGSSWPEDEEIYIDWFKKRANVKLIIAPHEFNEKRLAVLKGLAGENTVLKSEAEQDPSLLKDARCVIIDCFGLLSSAYAYADIAYVGGGFGAGIHNINEAAAFGIPVIYGPNHSKFVEAMELKTLGGGLSIAGKTRFEEVADKLLFDAEERRKRGNWAGQYIEENTGATDLIFSHIFA